MNQIKQCFVAFVLTIFGCVLFSTSASAQVQCNFLAEQPFDFEGVKIGMLEQGQLVIANGNSPGGGSFTYTDFQLAGDIDFCVTNNACNGTTLQPGGSCTLTGNFTPRMGGDREALFRFMVTPSGPNPTPLSQCFTVKGKGTINPQLVERISQGSPSWATIPYGNCTAPNPNLNYNIRKKGCNLTSLTMAINYLFKAAPVQLAAETPPNLQTFARILGTNGFSFVQRPDHCTSHPLDNNINLLGITNSYKISTNQSPYQGTYQPFIWKPVNINSSSSGANTALTNLLEEGYPVVVGIKKQLITGNGCSVQNPCFPLVHFVLVKEDLGGGNYSVADPGNGQITTLAGSIADRGGIGWVVRGTVTVKPGFYDLPFRAAASCPANLAFTENYTARSNSREINWKIDMDSQKMDSTSRSELSPSVEGNINDASGLVISAANNISYIITDSQGRKTGFDNVTQQTLEQIPNSTFSIDGTPDYDNPNDIEISYTTQVSRPPTGTYQLTLKGLQTGTYQVYINRLNIYGQSQTEIVLSGNIQAGETKNHTFNYSPFKDRFDFNKDGTADFSVFRPSNGTWYTSLNPLVNYGAVAFGLANDKPVPADYDGDGRTDIAVYRNGTWYWLNSSNNTFNAYQFGISSDVPVPADYTGDGRTELAVYRSGVWYTLNLSNNQFQALQFGISSDKPVPADFDGDGKTDVAVYRNGTWYWLRSSDGVFRGVQFGIASDKVIVGDYDGDGKADQAVYRNGVWYLNRSTAGFLGLQFGISTDIPISADYDGDGKTDIAVFREGIWYLLQSSNNQFRAVQFGVSNDRPIPAVYVP